MYRDGMEYYDDERCHEMESVDCHHCEEEVALADTDEFELIRDNKIVNVCMTCINGRTS